MTPSVDLFLLIKSLNQAEKRYFKIYTSKISEGKHPAYLQLFQAIAAMDSYDEQKIKEKFKGKAFIKQLPKFKNYLTNVILQSLQGYHAESTAHNNLAGLLQTIEILYDRELLNLCLKQIEKGIRICKTYNKENFLFLFLDWKVKILMRRQEYAQLLVTIEAQKQINDNQCSYLQAKEKAFKIHHLLITKGFPRTEAEVEELKKETITVMKKSSSNSATIEEAYYHLFARSNFYAGTADHQNRASTIQQLIVTLEKNKYYSIEHPQLYISALNNYYNALVNSGQLKQAKEIFLKIRELAEQFNVKRYNARNYALLISYDKELELSTLTDETHKTILLVPHIEEIIEKSEGVFQKSYTLGLIYNTSRVLFIAGGYGIALDWVNRILNERMTHLRQDLNSAARILYLLIHYELGNDILLKGIISTTKSSLKYKKRLFKAEQTVLDYLAQLLAVKTEEEKLAVFTEFSHSLTQRFEDLSETVPEVFIDILAWIESKLTGKSMGKILKEKYLQEIKNKLKTA